MQHEPFVFIPDLWILGLGLFRICLKSSNLKIQKSVIYWGVGFPKFRWHWFKTYFWTIIKSIKTEAKYEAALRRIYDLMQLDYVENSLNAKEMSILADLIEAYEDVHFPILWKKTALPTANNVYAFCKNRNG